MFTESNIMISNYYFSKYLNNLFNTFFMKVVKIVKDLYRDRK